MNFNIWKLAHFGSKEWFHYYNHCHWNLNFSTYMLFADWAVRTVKNCDRGLGNAIRGRRLRATFPSPRLQLFTLRTDPKAANNLFIFFFSKLVLQISNGFVYATCKLDWNCLEFHGERNRITVLRYKQPSKLSQLQNTQLNLLNVTSLFILKWAAINLYWLIVDGSVKEAKDWRLPLNFQ